MKTSGERCVSTAASDFGVNAAYVSLTALPCPVDVCDQAHPKLTLPVVWTPWLLDTARVWLSPVWAHQQHVMALRPVYAGVPCAALPSHWTDGESTKQMRKKSFKSKTAWLSLI